MTSVVAKTFSANFLWNVLMKFIQYFVVKKSIFVDITVLPVFGSIAGGFKVVPP